MKEYIKHSESQCITYLYRGQDERSPPNGSEPVRREYSITPALHISTFLPS